MKKILLMLLTALMLFLPVSCSTQDTPRHPLMKGMNVATLQDGIENAQSWATDPATYKILKKSGFDHVRLPILWMAFMEDGVISEEYLSFTDQAIDAALEAELSVVIDFHGYLVDQICADVEKYEQTFYDMWEQIARRYAKYPNDLYFELINEPSPKDGPAPMGYEDLNRLQRGAIEIIREISPTRPIAVASFDWNSAESLHKLELPTVEEDPNIIVSVHCYSNMDFTHQGAWWDPMYAEISGVRFSDGSEGAIKRALREAAAYQKATGREIWFSEFGVALTDAVAKEDVSEYAAFFTDLCESYGFGWCYWEFAGTFGAYDPDAGAWKDFVYGYLM